jgi:hypothetical protein
LGERLLCKQEVIGSIPFTSTNGHLHHGCDQPAGERGFRREAPPGATRLPRGFRLGEEHATPLRGDPQRGVD